MAEDALARFVSTELAKRGWNQTDLGREAALSRASAVVAGWSEAYI